MLYKLPRKDIKILIGYDFSRKYLKGSIEQEEFTDWLGGFREELQTKDVKSSSIDIFGRLMKANPSNLLFFELFDVTRSPKNGEILNRALSELAKYQDILICPEPGEEDIQGYEFVSELVKFSYNATRRQIDLTALSNLLISVDVIEDNPFSNKIFILDKDMYTPGRTNWCYGQVQPVTSHRFGEINFDMLFCSTARVKSESFLYDLFAHEIGHMLNAAPPRRTNTTEELGSHCTNHLCVMQQKVESGQAEEYAKLRHSAGAQLFCHQCISDIQNYRSKFTLKDLLKVKFL